MAANDRLKKSETIEIRLSYAAKTAFVARCRDEQDTASDAIRRFIDSRIAPPPPVPRLPHWRTIAAAALGIAFGAGVAAPSFAHAAAGERPSFEQLDRNHDGVIDASEYRAR